MFIYPEPAQCRPTVYITCDITTKVPGRCPRDKHRHPGFFLRLSSADCHKILQLFHFLSQWILHVNVIHAKLVSYK